MESRHVSSGSSRVSSSKPSSKGAGGAEKNLFIEAMSIVVFAASVFGLLSLLTFNPNDPSLFSNMRGMVQNACGRVGAYLASGMLQYFGLGGFLIPAALFFVSASIYKREGSVRLIGTLGGMAVAVMSLTVFLTLQWKYWPYAGTLLLTGGAFGVWVADQLVSQFNSMGSSIVALLVFCLAIAFSTPVSVARVMAWVLRHSASIAWRTSKIVAVYLAYLLGLLAARLARATGELIQGLIEHTVERVKERKAEAARAKEQAKADAAAAKTEAAASRRVPAIGAEGADDVQDSEEDEASDDDETSEGEGPGKNTIVIGPQLPLPAPVLGAGLHSEAPNALPELEKRNSDKTAADGDQKPASTPAILPPEAAAAAAALADDKSVAEKVTRKLARAAARVRRGQWKLPTIEFLRKPPKIESSIDREKLIRNSQTLIQKFADFGIEGEVTAVRPGPVITLYEFKPGPGVKVSRIAALADDLSMALSAQSVRILAPLPGKSVVGIEIPSDTRETVYMREFLQHPDFYGQKHALPVVMGKDIGGQPYLSDLARMPHLLCAGQTGAGKSVFMNGLICSLLYRFTPDELRLIMVDPKVIELRPYQDIPHLLLPVVDDTGHASTALKWAVREMERRYKILAKVGARNLATFNQKVEEMGAEVIRDLLCSEENQGEDEDSPLQSRSASQDWMEAFEPDELGAPKVGKLPYIVIIIDELADLMMVAKKEVEVSIARIAQKARAAGLHLVIATQRPSTDVVTGLIKANLPSRVSFQLASFVDSKTILDRSGAERLLGQGDMLFIPPGTANALRLQGAFVDDEEIHKITSFLKEQGKPVYRDEILLEDNTDEDGLGDDAENEDDEMFGEAVELVKRTGQASASFLQRHLRLGYNRAARMIETMETRGIVGPADGSRPREVLIR